MKLSLCNWCPNIFTIHFCHAIQLKLKELISPLLTRFTCFLEVTFRAMFTIFIQMRNSTLQCSTSQVSLILMHHNCQRISNLFKFLQPFTWLEEAEMIGLNLCRILSAENLNLNICQTLHLRSLNLPQWDGVELVTRLVFLGDQKF